MSGYQPVVPQGGLAGWRFLSRTLEGQKEAFEKTSSAQRDIDYFRENVAKVTSAEDLVSDRRLLDVALTAFGLEDDLPNKFFIRKVLEGDPSSKEALAGKLADKRYAALSDAFGFWKETGPNTSTAGFADGMLARFSEMSFEQAVGEAAPELRLALSLERELGAVIDGTTSNNARWFAIMGNGPLREIFENAFGLSSSFGALDIDRQLDELKAKSRAMFGTDEVADLLSEENIEDLRNTYLLRAEPTASTATSPALQILTGSSSSGNSILSILYS